MISSTMPMGRYWVGDLCYVLRSNWEDVCSKMFGEGDGDGVFTLENGTKITIFSTKYGDGTYEDQFNNQYPVDSGTIGCVLLADIKDEDANLALGNIFDFESVFSVSSEDGLLMFDYIIIKTGEEDPEEEDDYLEEDEN